MKVALPIPNWGELSRSCPRPQHRDRPIPATSSLKVNYESKEDSIEDWGGELSSHLEEALAARDRAIARCLPPPSLLRSLEYEVWCVEAG
jgi:hypothetical protein